ncbi:MAG: DUF4395 domain-containing protein [Bacteroidetes bacterium]|nr:DUF4395 domain-containing protein [Bacteroidota bacterium]
MDKNFNIHFSKITILLIMNIKDVICPVSFEKIDSNVSRITIFLNVILMVFFVFTLNPVFIGIVTIDYFIRATMKVKYSPIRVIAIQIANVLKLHKNLINQAQKVFASRLGFLCAFTALVLIVLGHPSGAISIAGILLILSTLDSVFNFCVGCLIYNYLVYPFYKNK